MQCCWSDGRLTEEGTSGKDGSDEGLTAGFDEVASGMGIKIVSRLAKEAKPVFHRGDTSNGTS